MRLNVRTVAASSQAVLDIDGQRLPVLVGRSGATPATEKREGDGASPLGQWTILYGMYRADRVAKPTGPAHGGLAWLAIQPDMGWCDAAEDPLYNQPVPVGYPASHETLWRDDAAYDYVLVLDHNQRPVVPGAGSAVFVHVWRDGATHTEGCVALKMADMARLVAGLGTGDVLEIGV